MPESAAENARDFDTGLSKGFLLPLSLTFGSEGNRNVPVLAAEGRLEINS